MNVDLYVPVVTPHPFRPDEFGTQCVHAGCWGWADDPRHLHHDVLPKLPWRPLPPGMVVIKTPRAVRRRAVLDPHRKRRAGGDTHGR